MNPPDSDIPFMVSGDFIRAKTRAGVVATLLAQGEVLTRRSAARQHDVFDLSSVVRILRKRHLVPIMKGKKYERDLFGQWRKCKSYYLLPYYRAATLAKILP